jgi:N,N'-diacetyllegionaminate synthase
VIIRGIDTTREPLVVAEIGNNHEGSMDTARELVLKAAEAGVRAVKFQTFRTESYVSRSDAARFQRLKSFELSPDHFVELAALTHDQGMAFLSTPFDRESAHVLEPLVDAYKIASGDNDFYPLLETVCSKEKPIIISTGLADLDHVRRVVDFVRARQSSDGPAARSLAVLHCVSCYPVPPDNANLRAISSMVQALDCEVGYSDHTLGPAASIAAVALGARIIEKHFTLSKTFSEFRDHQLSADPDEMRFLVAAVRDVALMLGDGVKTLQPCEVAALPLMRRSIVAASDLAAGHVLTSEDLDWVRPRNGLSPGQESGILGRRLVRDIAAGEAILPEMVQG